VHNRCAIISQHVDRQIAEPPPAAVHAVPECDAVDLAGDAQVGLPERIVIVAGGVRGRSLVPDAIKVPIDSTFWDSAKSG
jgi:hypothetical protein